MLRNMIVQVVLKDRELTKINVHSFTLRANGDNLEALYYRLNDLAKESYPISEVKCIYYNEIKNVVVDLVSDEHVHRIDKIKSGSLKYDYCHGDRLSAIHTCEEGDWIVTPFKFVNIHY